MRAHEHRTIGDVATDGALVNVGGDRGDERFLLTYGDVVALSGDFFLPGSGPAGDGSDASDRLFELAARPGRAGAHAATRDEVVCALKVASVDEDVADPRFEPGGRFAGFRFSAGADRSTVERRVRDRYLALAAVNDDHFVAPGCSDAATGSGAGSAPAAYRRLHHRALDEARRLGHRGGDVSQAMAREAAAQHFLTDAFAAGHLRTPVADIRRYWKARYPAFWDLLQRKVARDTATALREVSRLLRALPADYVHRRTLSELRTRTSAYPELSAGDLVARVFHDWDNDHGLAVDGRGRLFGDGHVDEGVTKDLALAAVQAGIDDIEVAFGVGRSGSRLTGPALYGTVREATGSVGRWFAAETRVARVSPDNPSQNWRAPDVETLWDSPIVGAAGPTVGDALTTMLEPGGEFIRQLEGLGRGLSGDAGVFGLPFVGAWLGDRCCHAYHQGFVQPLARDPKRAILALVPDHDHLALSDQAA